MNIRKHRSVNDNDITSMEIGKNKCNIIYFIKTYDKGTEGFKDAHKTKRKKII